MSEEAISQFRKIADTLGTAANIANQFDVIAERPLKVRKTSRLESTWLSSTTTLSASGLNETVADSDRRHSYVGSALSKSFNAQSRTPYRVKYARLLEDKSLFGGESGIGNVLSSTLEGMETDAIKSRVESMLSAARSLAGQCEDGGLDNADNTLDEIQTEFGGLSSALTTLEKALSKYSDGDASHKNHVEQHEYEYQTKYDALEGEVNAMEQVVAGRVEQLERVQGEIEECEKRRAARRELQEKAEALHDELTDFEAVIEEKQAVMEERNAERQTLSTVLKSLQCQSPGASAAKTQAAGESVSALQEECDSLQKRSTELTTEIEDKTKQRDSIVQSSQEIKDLDAEISKVKTAMKGQEQREHSMNASIGALRGAIERLIDNRAKENDDAAVALTILKANRGEMLLDELKQELLEHYKVHDESRAKMSAVLQTIYTVVANGLIRIDRSQAQNTVMTVF